jgi:predicted nucleic acid-binding protein
MEYLEGSPAGAKLRDELNDAGNNFFTHAVTLAEVISKVKQRGKDSDIAWKVVTSNSKLLSADASESRQVGLLHAEIKSRNPNFSLADAFVLASSRKIGAKLLTGDPDFKGLPGTVMLR